MVLITTDELEWIEASAPLLSSSSSLDPYAGGAGDFGSPWDVPTSPAYDPYAGYGGDYGTPWDTPSPTNLLWNGQGDYGQPWDTPVEEPFPGTYSLGWGQSPAFSDPFATQWGDTAYTPDDPSGGTWGAPLPFGGGFANQLRDYPGVDTGVVSSDWSDFGADTQWNPANPQAFLSEPPPYSLFDSQGFNTRSE